MHGSLGRRRRAAKQRAQRRERITRLMSDRLLRKRIRMGLNYGGGPLFVKNITGGLQTYTPEDIADLRRRFLRSK